MLQRHARSRSRTALSCLALGLSISLLACIPDLGASSGDGGGGAGGGSTTTGDTGTGGIDMGDTLAQLRAPKLPTTMLSYADKLPASFSTPVVQHYDDTPADNPITDAGATLGRVLFYDRRLSVNGKIACATCHQQSHGFSDSAARVT